MEIYIVKYWGNSTQFRNFECEVAAYSKREAVEQIFSSYNEEDYFPQEDGSILDCGGNLLAEAEDETIEYDGGFFYAEELLD